MPNYKVVDADQLDADITAIADAIRNKSDASDPLAWPDGLVQTVGSIQPGVNTSGDTVTADTLLEGITAHNAAGEQITGTVKHHFFAGEIVSTVLGGGAYAVLCNDPMIAAHFYDPNLWIKVRFDIESTPYTIIETWGFNTSVASSPSIHDRTGQHVLRYSSSGDRTKNVMGVAINGVNEVGTPAGVGCIEITESGDVRICSNSVNYAIRPSKYTVEVNWNA